MKTKIKGGNNMTRLSYVLELYNLTQQELADKLQIKRQNIDAWLRKRRKIPEKHLVNLSKIFKGIDSSYFQKELTEIEKIDIQKTKILNDSNEIEYIDSDAEQNIRIRRVLKDNYDVFGARYLDYEKNMIITINRIKKIVSDTFDSNVGSDMNSAEEALYKANRIISLYEKVNQILSNEKIRIDVVEDIVNGMIEYRNDCYGKKQNTFTKKIISSVNKEQLKREEKDRMILQQEQEDFINAEVNRYKSEQQSISPEEKERREMMSKLFK
ncbi:helix-turn-helix transcriptional regulator [Clostridium botulinum]|nr:helix-turn-helix transcriptional regulator [Clostridium botulinum]NFL59278.1 helix-turn-helix transcriptional regulator [Clostridium botulinum]NFL63198.1 helix-turn-helix transcriptional regulator [Clostridium botulinum]NFO67280.1 helix-turn-helix transcriptional regulator [Clostridium botulinum]